MKRTLLLIVISLALACFIPAHIGFCCVDPDTVSISSETVDNYDNLTQRCEHANVNFVAFEKRVKFQNYIKPFIRTEIYPAVIFNIAEFNEDGVLNEIIKRDYSGEDPNDIDC